MFRFPSEQNNLPIDPVFSNWVDFIEKVLIINCSRNSKSLKSNFFFETRKLKVFQKKKQFFSSQIFPTLSASFLSRASQKLLMLKFDFLSSSDFLSSIVSVSVG